MVALVVSQPPHRRRKVGRGNLSCTSVPTGPLRPPSKPSSTTQKNRPKTVLMDRPNTVLIANRTVLMADRTVLIGMRGRPKIRTVHTVLTVLIDPRLV